MSTDNNFYEENLKQWEDEKKNAAEFWSNFLAKLKQVRDEREKKDPVYKNESVLFAVDTGHFQHEFVYTDEEYYKLFSILIHANSDDFEAIRKDFELWKKLSDGTMAAKEPQRKDFFAEKNYEQAVFEWKYEKIDIKDFIDEFEQNFDKIKQQKLNADQNRKRWVDLDWNSTTLGLTFKEANNIAQKDLLKHSVASLEDALINEAPKFYTDTKSKIIIFTPIKDAFFSSQNYEDAKKQSEKNMAQLEAFYTRIQKALKRAIRTLTKQAQTNVQPPQPSPIPITAPPVVDDPIDFPDDPNSLKVVKRLGGSTGAELVEAPDGTRYVRKRGNNEGHVRSECYADAFYRAAGADVPEFRLYDTSNGPVKLSRYYEGTTSLSDWWRKASKKEKDAMSAALRKQYATDVLLGNWDVVGMDADNILIDKHGKPWRIDNGGAMSYKAMGGTKPDSSWNDGFVDDLWTMTGNGSRIGNNASSNIPKYFGQVDVGEIARDINSRDWSASLARLPIAERAVVERRLEEIRQLAERDKDFSENGYTREYTLSILDETYKYSKKGLREACSFTCDLKNGDYGWFRKKNGGRRASNNVSPEQQKDSDMQDKLLAALKTINYNTPKKQPLNQSKINAVLDLKQDLQDAVAKGLPNAQHYLGIINDIEDAIANNTTTKNPKYSLDKPMYAAQPKPQTQQQTTPDPSLRSSCVCLSDFLRKELGDEAVNTIEERNHAQGSNSYGRKSCRTKFLRMRAQGYDLADPKYKDFASFYNDVVRTQQVGYYLGDPNGSRSDSYSPGTHYDHLEDAFDYFKQNPVDYNKHYDEMMKYNAGLQIALENSNFTGNDHSKRQVVLMRTETSGVCKTKTIGKKSDHLRGVNESHSIIRTVVIAGNKLTMVRVPYSRINGFYMMKSGENFDRDMYLGDGENEVSADTHNLPAYYMGQVSSGKSVFDFVDKLEEYEKKNP